MIFLVDLDGTLADCSHRLHHIQNHPKNWRGFFADCAGDRPIQEVIDTVNLLAECADIVICSGRSDECRKETVQWLVDHDVHFGALYMRKAGDHREDSIVKSEILDKILSDNNWKLSDITAVFDDRNQVVDMWRKRGLRAFQVANGDF